MGIALLFSFLYLSPKILLIAAAVIPALVLLFYIHKKDTIEKEPPSLLIGLVLWGALATLLAVVTESIGSALLAFFLPGGEYSKAYGFWMYFVIVALSEEGFKYLLLKWRTWRSPHFNCRFDGLVYAVFISLGFALWENIGYVLMYGLGTALARAITAVPGHASFGVFMGACYGFAKQNENLGDRDSSLLWRFFAILIPTLLHGCYDYIATSVTETVTTTFLVFVAAMFISAFVLVKKMSAKDRFI